MKVYLMRHAQAVSSGGILPDGSRYLSADGRQTARRVATALRAEGVELDAILASPLVRAMQTAELVAGGVDYLGLIETFDGLAPGCEPQVVARALTTRGGSVAVVSHEPTVSYLAAFLLGVPSFQPFRPGQVCLIEGGRPAWRLDPRTAQIQPQF